MKFFQLALLISLLVSLPFAANASARLSPASPTACDDLFGYCNATMNGTFNSFNFIWYKNGVVNISGTLFREGGISVGTLHVCGIRANDSQILCWGTNWYGQLGDGTTIDRHVPTLTTDTSPYGGVFLSGKEYLLSTLSRSSLKAGDKWTFSCRANGTSLSNWSNSTPVTIQPCAAANCLLRLINHSSLFTQNDWSWVNATCRDIYGSITPCPNLTWSTNGIGTSANPLLSSLRSNLSTLLTAPTQFNIKLSANSSSFICSLNYSISAQKKPGLSQSAIGCLQAAHTASTRTPVTLS